MKSGIILLTLCSILLSLTHAEEAIFLGSSGLVGSLVLQQLLDSPHWETIHVVVRKPLTFQHPKIQEILIPDLTQMATDKQLLELAATKRGQIVAAVVTLGVNEAFGWTIQQLWDVEVTLTSLFAEFCHSELDVKYISLLSGVGTERGYTFSAAELATELNVWNLYSLFTKMTKVKGHVEMAVVNSDIPYQSFFRPANFETDEYRFGNLDIMLQSFFSRINFMLPSEYHSIHVKDIALAMFIDMEQARKEFAEMEVLEKKETIKRYDEMVLLVSQAESSAKNYKPEL